MSGHVLLQEALESLVVRPDQATRHHNQVGTRWCEGRPIESSGSKNHLSPGSNADLNQNDILFAHEFRACQNAGSHGSCFQMSVEVRVEIAVKAALQVLTSPVPSNSVEST